mgnify:CR=1 FL=1
MPDKGFFLVCRKFRNTFLGKHVEFPNGHVPEVDGTFVVMKYTDIVDPLIQPFYLGRGIVSRDATLCIVTPFVVGMVNIPALSASHNAVVYAGIIWNIL